MTKQVKIFIIATLAISAMLIGGSYLASKGIQLPLKKPQSTPLSAANLIKTSPLFDSQTATIHGQVIQVIHNTLVTIQVKNNTGLTEDFPVVSNLIIYKYKPSSTEATASADLKTIELNKDALIVLEHIKGEYKVMSISYLASPSSSPTPKAKK